MQMNKCIKINDKCLNEQNTYIYKKYYYLIKYRFDFINKLPYTLKACGV